MIKFELVDPRDEEMFVRIEYGNGEVEVHKTTRFRVLVNNAGYNVNPVYDEEEE